MKRKDLMLLLIPTFIFVVAWTGFSIYHGFVTSTIPANLNTQISPITPSFDTKTINALKDRQDVNPIYDINPAIISNNTGEASSSASVNPSPTPEVSVTPTPTVSQIQQSTSGGTLSQ